MHLKVNHNLEPEELRKALSAMAAASGIEQQVIETLQKASCDDTPKEPRSPAVRLIYHMMLQEFWQAGQDIERYARGIADGTLQKSAPALTAEQLRQLQQAIKDRYEYVAAQLQTVGYQPPADLLERWKALGLVAPDVSPGTFAATVPAEMHFIRNAYLMGKFIKAVESGKTFAQVMELARHAPLLKPDLQAISIAEQQTAMYITDNAADLATRVGQAAIQQRNSQIRQMAIDFHRRTLARQVLDREEKELAGIPTPDLPVETWRQFASELHHTMTDKARDWERVAYYELTDAQKQGQAQALLADGNVDKLVYKMPLPTACAQCRYLYLQADGASPRLFKLSTLIGNGTNIGRKPHPIKRGVVDPAGRSDGQETLKAVAGLIHCWCACGGPYEYTGHEVWAKK